MKDAENTKTCVDVPDEKLPYSKPALVEHGTVQELTRGDSGTSDAGPGGRGGN